MSRWSTLFAVCAVFNAALWLSGCGSSADSGPASGGRAPFSGVTSPAGGGHDHEHGDDGHEHGDDGHEHAEGETTQAGASDIGQALAALSAEDRALAEKQQRCPVSDEALGSMGAPIKLEINGKTVFICCSACEDSLREAPDKFLAKLPQ